MGSERNDRNCKYGSATLGTWKQFNKTRSERHPPKFWQGSTEDIKPAWKRRFSFDYVRAKGGVGDPWKKKGSSKSRLTRGGGEGGDQLIRTRIAK